MGRMADARKRSRKSKGGGDEGMPRPSAVSDSSLVLPPPAVDPPPESDFAFPDEKETGPAGERDPGPAPAAGASGKIDLPASGTAEEILARHDAALAATEAQAVAQAIDDAVQLSQPTRASSVSFFAAPAREERVAVEAAEQLATFFLDREEYGVDVRLVQGFRRVTEITQVPRVPAFIKGVINLRGRIIPVVDLKRKLALGEVAASRAARIMVVKIQERILGLLVDGASQVLKVPVSSIEQAPDEVLEKGGDYIRGVAKLEKRLIILVDLLRILALDDGSPRAASA
jgi:purine-binding chemotaxis protein CheW